MAYKWEGQDILAPLTFRSNQTVWTVEKLDKSIDRIVHPSQRWELEFSVLTNENEHQMFDRLTNKFANKGTMVMPSILYAMGAGKKPTATQLKVGIAAAANASSVVIQNSGDEVGLRKGTFIQFGNHDKVYAVTGSETIGASSSASVNIFPNLRKSLPLNGGVKAYDDVTFHYYLDDTMMKGITYQDGVLTGVDRIALLEAV